MIKDLFGLSSRYQRQARHYLETAKLSALEHEVAAEHHAALAKMYRERANRLEQEVSMFDFARVERTVEPRISAVK